jgi:hypothetical protein
MQLLHHTKSGVEKKCSSQYRGVSWDKKKNKWRTTVGNNGRRHIVAYSDSEIQAARIYNEASIKLGRDILNILPL